MGDAPGELTYSFHLLRLSQRLLSPFDPGDILKRPDHPHGSARRRVADHFRHVADGDLAVVPANDAILDVIGNSLVDRPLDSIFDHRPVFRRYEAVKTFVRHLEPAGLL